MKHLFALRSISAILLAIGFVWTAIPSQAAIPQASRTNAGTTLRMAYFGGPTTEAQLQPILKYYQKHYHASVSLEPFPSTRDKEAIEIAAGTGPDVMMNGDGDVRWYAFKNQITNLMPYIKKDKYSLSQYVKGTLTIGYKGKGLYALPKDYSTIGIYYNKDMFRAAGVPFPSKNWTWSTFRKDAIKLTKNGVYGASLPGDWVRAVDPVVRSFGGALDNANGTKVQGYMNSPKTVKAITFWVNLFLKDKVAPTPTEASSLGVGDLFASQKAAMSLTGVWPSLGDTGYVNTLKFNWGVAPFPRGSSSAKKVNTICYAGFTMTSTSKHKQLGWDLIKTMSGPVGDNVWGTAGGLPALKSVAKKHNVYKNKVFGVFLRQAKFSNLPSDINGPAAPQAVSDTLSQGLDLVLNTPGQATVKQMLDIEAQKGQAAINQYYGK